MICTARLKAGELLYRCTKKTELPSLVRDLGYPPSEMIKTWGRLNNIGESIFYSAETPDIAILEVNPEINETFVISRWKVIKDVQLNHVGFSDGAKKYLNSSRDLQCAHSFNVVSRQAGELHNAITDFLAEKFVERVEKDQAHKYKLTIAIGRKLLCADFLDGVVYPSIAINGNGNNVALKTVFVDQHLEFEEAKFDKVIERVEGGYKFQKLKVANIDRNTGKLQWQDV